MQNVEFAQKTHVGITQTKDLMTSQHREEHCRGKIESGLDGTLRPKHIGTVVT